MQWVFKFSSTFGEPLVDAHGRPGGTDSGGALLRRLMRLVPDPILIGEPRATVTDWEIPYRVLPVSAIDVNDSVVVNMDVIDSPDLYRVLRRGTWRLSPRIVNFVWWNVSEWTDRVELASIGLSAAKFPTFCNSARTEDEIRTLIVATTSASVAWKAQVEHQALGIPDPVTAQLAGPPVIAYPSMWLFDRKRPKLFQEIVTSVAARCGAGVRVRLRERELRRPLAEQWAGMAGWDVAGLVPWEQHLAEMGRSPYFVATALDESYGLQYGELLRAGSIGVFPRRDWIWTLLPSDYPFVYDSADQARTMLQMVIGQRDVAWRLLGKTRDGLASRHRPQDFDEAFVETVKGWMG